MRTVLITGASGRVGTVLRKGLEGRYGLRLFDRQAPADVVPSEETVVGDLRDYDDVVAAARGVDAIVHLGGRADEAPFGEILEDNIRGTYHVFEAARREGVPRVVFASTNHVIGFYPAGETIPTDVPYRPDTYYGVSKAFGESLGRLYHDKWGLEVVCLRIGSFRERPEGERQLSTWLSHRDGVSLVRRAIDAEDVGFTVVYGVSDNRRSWWRNGEAARRLGWHPEDDAEAFADAVQRGERDAVPGSDHQGGSFTDAGYGGGLG